jgi:hypothetical protein
LSRKIQRALEKLHALSIAQISKMITQIFKKKALCKTFLHLPVGREA